MSRERKSRLKQRLRISVAEGLTNERREGAAPNIINCRKLKDDKQLRRDGVLSPDGGVNRSPPQWTFNDANERNATGHCGP